LQIPKDLREQLGMQRYVRLEVVEGGIMIRPVEDTAEHQDAKSHFNELSNAPSERSWRAWLQNRGKKS
jgi:bifunctional DNA-binding transcriptional regulator/antitoxin component of YhaV-PrlF toxin-antitoxin module